MSYIKRTINHTRLVRVADTHGETLFPLDPAPFYRCEDRPRRLPIGHAMAARRDVQRPAIARALPPLIYDGGSRVLAGIIAAAMVAVTVVVVLELGRLL